MKPGDVQALIEESGNREQTYVGSRVSRLGVKENIGVEDRYRLTHVLNIGPTGYGKSQLIAHCVLQDAEKNRGLAVINPKGRLIDQILLKLPEHRLDDVIYINPGRTPVTPINVLQPQLDSSMTDAQVEHQKEIIVSDLIDLFQRLSKNWGDRFGRLLETLLRAHINLNIREEAGKTLVDVFQAVTDSQALSDLIDETDDPVIRKQLVRIDKDLSSRQLEPLQRRLNDFVMKPTIRRIIGNPESGLDFQEAVNHGKIILVDIQKGEVGGTVSELVGSIVITKIWAAAQSRINTPEKQRNPFYLYVDELQNFAGEASNFASILSEAREYGLGCWLATQYLQQLNPEMQKSITNNCRTKISFNPGGSDNTSKIAGMFHGLNQVELIQLGKYRAAFQMPSEKRSRTAVIFDTFPPWTPGEERDIDQLKQDSSTGVNADNLENQLSLSLGSSANAGGKRHQAMLEAAKAELGARGFQVNLLYQDSGDEKPDGHVFLPDEEIAHLEAELSTLTKPAKVLQNLRRAHEKGREVYFVVEKGSASKLENIVSDPVNRRGAEHEDKNGKYSYYTDSDGQPVTDTEELKQAPYRILELDEGELNETQEDTQPECPELTEYGEEELKEFCLHRESDGYCTALGQQCVLTSDD